MELKAGVEHLKLEPAGHIFKAITKGRNMVADDIDLTVLDSHKILASKLLHHSVVTASEIQMFERPFKGKLYNASIRASKKSYAGRKDPRTTKASLQQLSATVRTPDSPPSSLHATQPEEADTQSTPSQPTSEPIVQERNLADTSAQLATLRVQSNNSPSRIDMHDWKGTPLGGGSSSRTAISRMRQRAQSQ